MSAAVAAVPGWGHCLSGIGWVSLGQGVGLTIRLGSHLLLTRLLVPEAYGLFGPAMAVLMTLEWFCDLGVQPALVRDPDGGTFPFLNTGWWISLSRGVCVGLTTLALALPLSQFYGQPGLAAVLAALAFYPVLMALRSPGVPLLRRRLEYRALFADEVVQTLTGAAVTLAAAWYFRSPWAIAVGMLGGAAAGVVMSYILCPVRPRREWDARAARRILHVSRAVLVNTLLMALWINSDRLLGLRLVSLEEMGLYAVAWNLAGILDSFLSRACDVYYSLLSRLEDLGERARRHHLVCTRVALVLMPAMGVGVLLGPLAVGVIYDPRYHGAGLFFAVLLARLMVRSLGQIQFQYLLSLARLRAATWAYLAALVVQLAILIPFARQWGGLGLALSALVSTTVFTLTQSLLMWRSGLTRLAPTFLTVGWMLVALFLVLR